MQNSTRGSRPPLKNSIISSAGALHRPENAVSHARAPSTAQKLPNLTRRSRPPLRNREISRAGTVHRSGIAQFHAQEPSTAQESQNRTRGPPPPLRNRGIPARPHATTPEMQKPPLRQAAPLNKASTHH